MGFEFIFFALIVPLAQRLGDRWLDAAAVEIDGELRGMLKRVVTGLARPEPDLRMSETSKAHEELKEYVQRHSDAEAQLISVAREVRVAVQPDTDLATRRVEQYLALLKFLFDRVDRLQRPVALPGFFNCETCVVVVDARTEATGLGEVANLAMPEISTFQGVPRVELAVGPDAVRDAIVLGKPRVWIIRSDSEQQRDQQANELNRRFTRAGHIVPGPVVLGVSLSDDPPAELVASITSDWVQRHEWYVPSSPELSLAERILEQVKTGPSDADEFYEIGRPVGVKLLRDALERMLEEQWAADEEWRLAVSQV